MHGCSNHAFGRAAGLGEFEGVVAPHLVRQGSMTTRLTVRVTVMLVIMIRVIIVVRGPLVVNVGS